MTNGKGRTRLPPWVTRLAILLLIAGVLEVITRLNWISPVILVPPSDMFVAVWHIVVNGQLFPNLWRTVWEVLISIGIAIAVGIPCGMVFWRAPLLERVFEPYLVGLYAMPLILFYPFALVIFGLGSMPIIIVSATMGFVPVVLNSVAAFKGIPDIYFRVGRAYRCGGLSQFFRITLPSAAPILFAGFKLALIYCFIGVIVMEFMTGNTGLGFQVSYSYDAFQIAKMYAYVIVISLLATLIVSLLNSGEKALRRGTES